MTNHPNRALIDFSTPCIPDIHAMPKNMQDAGSKIRREIQRLYGRIEYETRCEHITQHLRPSRYAALGKAPPAVPASRGDAAQKAYDDLYEAYHAWSQTASRLTPFRANPGLLAAAYLAGSGAETE